MFIGISAIVTHNQISCSDKHPVRQKVWAHDYFLCAQLQQAGRECCASLQISISSVSGIQTLMYTRKPCVKSAHSCEIFNYLDHEFSKSGKLLLKLEINHSGNFAPRKINPLYGIRHCLS